VVQLAADGSTTRFDVAQALAVGQLGEAHRQILVPTGEAPVASIAAIALHASLKFLVRKMLHPLREDRAPSVHQALSILRDTPRKTPIRRQSEFKSFPSRDHPKPHEIMQIQSTHKNLAGQQ
jgi:hypothetical protein